MTRLLSSSSSDTRGALWHLTPSPAVQNNRKPWRANQVLAAELVQAINMPSLTSVPAYISEADATSVEEFLQCKLAKDLVVDTSKIHVGWRSE